MDINIILHYYAFVQCVLHRTFLLVTMSASGPNPYFKTVIKIHW